MRWPNARKQGRIASTLPSMFRRLLLVIALFGLIPAAFTDAQPAPVFVFEGSGWGHGVGMSQWGAYGQALADPSRSGEEIAAYYYPGSQPATMSDLELPNDLLYTLEKPLWVNLGSHITLLHFTAMGGPLDLCLINDGEGPCPKPEHPQEGETWEFRQIDRNECGFFLDDQLQGTPGACRAAISWPDANGVQLRQGEEKGRLCSARRGEECEYRHGELKIRDDPNEIGFHVVLALGLEDYLRGIAELPDMWVEPGVNEAQVVAARTYAAFKFFQYETEARPADAEVDPGITFGRKDSCWCHLRDSTRDINYIGWAKEARSDGQPWQAGVDATQDRVLTYFGPDWEVFTEGGILQAFFTASSGGFTVSNRYGFFTEWNGRPSAVREWPYLTPVDDSWDIDPEMGNPHTSWERQVSASDLARWLGWEEVTDVTLLNTGSVSSAARVRFDGISVGAPKTITVAGARLRTALGLKSSNILSVDGELADPSATPEGPGEDEAAADYPREDPTLDVGNEGEAEIPFDQVPNFADAIGSVHARGIQALRQQSITSGCGNGFYYCPDEVVSRGALATFLLRAMDLEPMYGDRYSDVSEGHTHRGAIYAIADLGMTTGCGDGTRFCPDDPVTREVMAVFLARALDLNGEAVDRGFTDVPDTHPAHAEINAIAALGITAGCGDGTRFCPDDPVTRGSMATFLARAFIWR